MTEDGTARPDPSRRPRATLPLRVLPAVMRMLAPLLLLAPNVSAQDVDFRMAEAPREWSFPRDHGSHPEYATEWWYFTGSVRDASDRQFGYELTFFRVGLRPDAPESTSAWRARGLVLAHFAITDVAARRFQVTERLQRAAAGLAGAEQTGLRVWVGDWEARQHPDGHFSVKAEHGDMAIDLELAPTRSPVLHGRSGLSIKDEHGVHASHYASLPRMTTRGGLVASGQRFEVDGTTWMDHEFFTGETPREGLGWDWFSARFEDGRDLMLYRVRRPGSPFVHFGTLVDADGSNRPVDTSDISFTPLAHWTSPETGHRYPTAWRVELPAEGASFEVRGVLDEQEVVARRTVGFAYWEGLSRYEGSWQGRAIRGEGYVELTGYGGE